MLKLWKAASFRSFTVSDLQIYFFNFFYHRSVIESQCPVSYTLMYLACSCFSSHTIWRHPLHTHKCAEMHPPPPLSKANLGLRVPYQHSYIHESFTVTRTNAHECRHILANSRFSVFFFFFLSRLFFSQIKSATHLRHLYLYCVNVRGWLYSHVCGVADMCFTL